jgi:hypothetical protein
MVARLIPYLDQGGVSILQYAHYAINLKENDLEKQSLNMKHILCIFEQLSCTGHNVLSCSNMNSYLAWTSIITHINKSKLHTTRN